MQINSLPFPLGNRHQFDDSTDTSLSVRQNYSTLTFPQTSRSHTPPLKTAIKIFIVTCSIFSFTLQKAQETTVTSNAYAEEIESMGMALGEMNKLPLEKIEELTLNLIAQEECIPILERNNNIEHREKDGSII